MSINLDKKDICFEGVFSFNSFFFSDERGFLSKLYQDDMYEEFGVEFVPHEIISLNSHANVLRGLHIQRKNGQRKILSCISGKIFVVIVDLRSESSTFMKHESFFADNNKCYYIPTECALGTYAVENSFMLLWADRLHNSSFDAGIYYKDSLLNINWPIKDEEKIVLSQKDKELQPMASYLKEVNR